MHQTGQEEGLLDRTARVFDHHVEVGRAAGGAERLLEHLEHAPVIHLPRGPPRRASGLSLGAGKQEKCAGHA